MNNIYCLGYGDIYPVTVFGKLVSMVSSIVGIAVVALPAEVITGGYIDVIKDKNAMMLYDGRKRYE
ncbi:MAG TPA: hypothetical protein DD446_09200 [Coprococcus sp.]|nr:hypothetical protein [Coprococcus sp.]HBN41010.1 hypothetical protein [Coprococcus sp.]